MILRGERASSDGEMFSRSSSVRMQVSGGFRSSIPVPQRCVCPWESSLTLRRVRILTTMCPGCVPSGVNFSQLDRDAALKWGKPHRSAAHDLRAEACFPPGICLHNKFVNRMTWGRRCSQVCLSMSAQWHTFFR